MDSVGLAEEATAGNPHARIKVVQQLISGFVVLGGENVGEDLFFELKANETAALILKV